jgi:simple sugar transport system permease protein
MTLVIATGGIDLSVGAVMAVAGAVAARLAVADHSLAAVLGAALLAAAGLGLFNGLLVTLLEIQPIVATLVLMVAGRGIAQILTAGQVLTFQHDGLSSLGSGGVLGVPAAAVVALLWFVLVLGVVRCTGLGLFLEALGDNPRAARLVGLPARGLALGAYAACSLGAGAAGVLATADIRGADANNVGLDVELDAILAVVLGGTALTGGRFTLTGTLVGALLLQSVTTAVVTSGVPVTLVRVVKAVAILAVCLLRVAPWHRLGSRVPEVA